MLHLTLSAWQIKTDTYVNSVDPDEMARNEPSHQDLPGWLGEAKVSCILHHQGVQLILAYIWARPAILIVGKSKGGMFLFLLFLHLHSFSFLPCLSLSSPLLSLFSLSLGDHTK